MEYAIRTALIKAYRAVRAPLLSLSRLLRATVDARRLHRAAPYTEVQALALHTHTRKERSSSAPSAQVTVLGRPFGGSARVQGVRVAVGEAYVKALAGPGVLPRGGVGVGGG